MNKQSDELIIQMAIAQWERLIITKRKRVSFPKLSIKINQKK
jgi:hypothetical protein